MGDGLDTVPMILVNDLEVTRAKVVELAEMLKRMDETRISMVSQLVLAEAEIRQWRVDARSAVSNRHTSMRIPRIRRYE